MKDINIRHLFGRYYAICKHTKVILFHAATYSEVEQHFLGDLGGE